jgi:FKBP-type peptidyl-prolyl cis-trans isomerase FkpA
MKKIFLFAPALFLLACGGEGDAVVDDVVDAIDTIVPMPEPEPEPELVVSTLSSDEEIQVFLEAKSWESQEPDENGMYIVIDAPGEGDARPIVTDEVTIFYQGYLLNGFKFDGSKDNIPLVYPLNRFIQGWQLGIPSFGKGGKGKLIIPPALAYGDADMGDIPPNSTLMFEIELINWQSQPAGY